MIKFGHIEYLFLLGIIPILVLLLFLFIKWRNKAQIRYSSSNIKLNINNKNIQLRRKIKYTLQFLTIFFLIIAITNPKIGTKLKEVKRDGIEIIIAIDLSKSMLCEDIKPNRLLRSKQSISNLIDNLSGDRIGLVVFAGEAYTQLPITSDYSAAKMFLSTINTKTISTQGTNIAEAIKQSVKSFNFDNQFNKSIIIITDGEGNIIVTKPNFSFLAELANNGNGININANNSEIGLKKLFDEINKIEKKEISDMMFTDYTDRFQLLLIISLILFTLNLIILDRKKTIKTH